MGQGTFHYTTESGRGFSGSFRDEDELNAILEAHPDAEIRYEKMPFWETVMEAWKRVFSVATTKNAADRELSVWIFGEELTKRMENSKLQKAWDNIFDKDARAANLLKMGLFAGAALVAVFTVKSLFD